MRGPIPLFNLSVQYDAKASCRLAEPSTKTGNKEQTVIQKFQNDPLSQRGSFLLFAVLMLSKAKKLVAVASNET